MANTKKIEKRKEGGLLKNIVTNPLSFNFDEILNREVTKFGNSGHIPIPSKHIGKKAIVTILKKEKKEEEKKKK